jgi:hypothetical protein
LRRQLHVTTALLAAAGGVLFAPDASAQSVPAPTGEVHGLRYVAWSGRGETASAPRPAAVAPASPIRRDLRRPNPVIPHGGTTSNATAAPTRPGLTPAPGLRRTLTPAGDWTNPVAPAPVPVPAPRPRAAPDALPDTRYPVVSAERIEAQPAPAAPLAPPPPPARTEPFDPMAPRRDAPIFRMQQDGPAPVPTAALPGSRPDAIAPPEEPQPPRVTDVRDSGNRPQTQGGRYYSVHRQNGRQPDRLEMPAPNYVDALAVTMPETIASQDLAAPQPGPTLIRDAQGRVRPMPAATDGDHQ